MDLPDHIILTISLYVKNNRSDYVEAFKKIYNFTNYSHVSHVTSMQHPS